MKRIIIITGQTATGKTALALKYAEKLNGELVNCDSRQIYKQLDIITGKDVTKKSKFIKTNTINNFDIGYYSMAKWLYGYIVKGKNNNITIKQYSNSKLWLYDVVDPKSLFSSFDYVQCAIPVIKDILSRGITPIIVGGSAFYLKHLLYGFSTNISPNWELRKQLEKKSVRQLQAIYQQYSNLTIKQLNNSDFNNPRRLIRRIEILSSASNLTEIPDLPNLSLKLGVKKLSIKLIGLKYGERKDLVKAISERVEKRLKQGAIDEVKNLLKDGYKESDPGLKTIGYQQIIDYLQDKLTLKETTSWWINKEVQYAKRQLTFLKKIKNIDWISL